MPPVDFCLASRKQHTFAASKRLTMAGRTWATMHRIWSFFMAVAAAPWSSEFIRIRVCQVCFWRSADTACDTGMPCMLADVAKVQSSLSTCLRLYWNNKCGHLPAFLQAGPDNRDSEGDWHRIALSGNHREGICYDRWQGCWGPLCCWVLLCPVSDCPQISTDPRIEGWKMLNMMLTGLMFEQYIVCLMITHQIWIWG